jgi:hypothetical protein
MLLAASSQVLVHSVLTMYMVALSNMARGEMPSGSPVNESGTPSIYDEGQRDTIPALHYCLYIAHSLVSGSGLWHVAKEHYPLLLIEAVLRTAIVSSISLLKGCACE